MLIVISVIFIAWLVLVAFPAAYGFWDIVGMAFLGAIVSGIVIGISLGLTAWYADHHPSPIREDTYNLAALSTGTGINGQFFLGYGSVNSEPMYYYYYKTDDGGLRMDYTNADSVVVKQDATPDTSYITYYCEDFDVNDFWTWPFGSPKWSECFNYVNEIHIPPNSITTEFDASLPNQ